MLPSCHIRVGIKPHSCPSMGGAVITLDRKLSYLRRCSRLGSNQHYRIFSPLHEPSLLQLHYLVDKGWTRTIFKAPRICSTHFHLGDTRPSPDGVCPLRRYSKISFSMAGRKLPISNVEASSLWWRPPVSNRSSQESCKDSPQPSAAPIKSS